MSGLCPSHSLCGVESRWGVINTLEYKTETIRLTVKHSDGSVHTLSHITYTKRVMTVSSPEKSPESLAVELLREGEMCSL